VDVLSFIAVITAYIWVVPPSTAGKPVWSWLFVVGIVSLAAVSLWRKGVTWSQAGLSFKNLPRDIAIYLGASVSYAGIVLLCCASKIELMERDWPDVRRIPWQLTWAFLQQFCLLAFLLNRFRQILRRDAWAAVAAAATFAFFHLPNPFLTLYALGGGLIAAFLFLRRPSLVAATFAHAVASALISNLLPAQITGWMRVGPLYWAVTGR
jgi:membrane protease YdiL (CAAX protease family)